MSIATSTPSPLPACCGPVGAVQGPAALPIWRGVWIRSFSSCP